MCVDVEQQQARAGHSKEEMGGLDGRFILPLICRGRVIMSDQAGHGDICNGNPKHWGPSGDWRTWEPRRSTVHLALWTQRCPWDRIVALPGGIGRPGSHISGKNRVVNSGGSPAPGGFTSWDPVSIAYCGLCPFDCSILPIIQSARRPHGEMCCLAARRLVSRGRCVFSTPWSAGGHSGGGGKSTEGQAIQCESPDTL